MSDAVKMGGQNSPKTHASLATLHRSVTTFQRVCVRGHVYVQAEQLVTAAAPVATG